MRSVLASISLCLLIAGCDQPAATNAPRATPPAVSATETQVAPTPPGDMPKVESPAPTAGPQMGDAGPQTAAAPSLPVPEGFTPVPVQAGIVKLTHENTTIQVIGKHAPPRGGPNDPNARKIVFEKFTGQLEVDPATKVLKSAKAEIDANSLATFNPGLTSHLKNQDFIDVEKFPTIKFESTRITPAGEAGKVEIVGNLTLHGETKEVTIPATVAVSGAGVTVEGKAQFDRNDFKVGTGRGAATMPEMEISLAVGKKTAVPAGN
jgi:polyisoprenoid-binding protein YceI